MLRSVPPRLPVHPGEPLTRRCSCLKNTVSLFHVIDLEQQWRIKNGVEAGFTTLNACRPVVAIGATNPIEGQTHEYDYFRKIRTLLYLSDLLLTRPIYI